MCKGVHYIKVHMPPFEVKLAIIHTYVPKLGGLYLPLHQHIEDKS